MSVHARALIAEAAHSEMTGVVDGTDTDTSIYTQQADELANVQSSFLKTRRDRGFLHQCTNIVELDNFFMSK